MPFFVATQNLSSPFIYFCVKYTHKGKCQKECSNRVWCVDLLKKEYKFHMLAFCKMIVSVTLAVCILRLVLAFKCDTKPKIVHNIFHRCICEHTYRQLFYNFIVWYHCECDAEYCIKQATTTTFGKCIHHTKTISHIHIAFIFPPFASYIFSIAEIQKKNSFQTHYFPSEQWISHTHTKKTYLGFWR